MKTRLFTALTLCLLLVPAISRAQQNIEQIFQNFPSTKGLTYEEKHRKEADPQTNKRIGGLDLYAFTKKGNATELVSRIKAAFRADAAEAYLERWQNNAKSESEVRVFYDDTHYETLGDRFNNYIFMGFADPTDKEFRTIYALEWNYLNKKQTNIQGRFFRAYCKIPTKKKNSGITIKYPTSNNATMMLGGDSIIILSSGDFSDLSSNFSEDLRASVEEIQKYFGQQGDSPAKDSAKWFSLFNVYKQRFLKNPAANSSIYYVTQIYKLCEKNDCLSDVEKNLITSELHRMLGKSKDTLIDTLLNASIAALLQ